MFIQGALRFFQGCASFKDSLKHSFFLSLSISIVISLIIASKSLPAFKPYNVQLYAYSIATDFFHDKFCSLRGGNNRCGMATVKLKNGEQVYTKSIQRNPFIRRDLNRVKRFVYSTFKISIGIFVLLFTAIVVFLTKSGNRNKQEDKIKTAKLVNKYLKKNKCLGDFKVGEMYLPKDIEVTHMLALGATGSGKSNLIRTLADQIKAKQQHAIVFDPTGEMIAKYYDEGDIIFNPFDDRTYALDLSEELSTPGRKDTFAKALFSFSKKESDPFWSDAPKRIFIDAFDKVILEQKQDIKALYDFLCRKNMKELRDEFKGYVSARFFDPSNSRTASSVMSKIISCIGWLEHISVKGKSKFSIKSFCEDVDHSKKGRWLFINAPRDTRHLFQDLNNALLSLTTTSIMKLDPNLKRRFWVIIEELASFDNLTDMSTAVAELRKYGVCVLSATQNLNQLNDIYGHFITKAMLDQFRTKFFFSSSNMDQEILTNCFGETEVRRDHESISFGTHEMRDGVNISESITVRPLVTSSNIFALKSLECYVALPEEPIRCAKIKVPFISPERITKQESTSKQSSS